MCVGVHVCMWCLTRLMSGIILNFSSILFIESGSLNKRCLPMTGLSRQTALGTSCLCLPKLVLQVDSYTQPTSTWVPGIQTLVLMLSWQELSTHVQAKSVKPQHGDSIDVYCLVTP